MITPYTSWIIKRLLLTNYWIMKITSAQFIKSAVWPPQYPPAIMPGIAFVGRSNVGKSSLINTLVGRRNLAKTSNTPGRTQLTCTKSTTWCRRWWKKHRIYWRACKPKCSHDHSEIKALSLLTQRGLPQRIIRYVCGASSLPPRQPWNVKWHKNS